MPSTIAGPRSKQPNTTFPALPISFRAAIVGSQPVGPTAIMAPVFGLDVICAMTVFLISSKSVETSTILSFSPMPSANP